MTREEARKHMMLWVYSLDDMPPKQVMEALTMAADALRPVSRERVEKVWRGVWMKTSEYMPIFGCSKCGERNLFRNGDNVFSDFCPACGSSMTDEAIEMMTERLEEMKDG